MKPAHSRALSVPKEEGREKTGLSGNFRTLLPDSLFPLLSISTSSKYRNTISFLGGRVASRWIHSHLFGVVGVRVKISFIDDKP